MCVADSPPSARLISSDALPLQVGQYSLVQRGDEPNWFYAISNDEPSTRFICKVLEPNGRKGLEFIETHARLSDCSCVNPICDCITQLVPSDIAFNTNAQRASTPPSPSPFPPPPFGDEVSPKRTRRASGVMMTGTSATVARRAAIWSRACSPLSAFRQRSSLSAPLPTVHECDDDDTEAPAVLAKGTPTVPGRSLVFVFLRSSGMSLYTYVRNQRRLPEAEARTLIRQIVDMMRVCHERGVCLRDLKMHKLVWRETELGPELTLESLDNAFIVAHNGDDRLYERQGTPAYCCPEMLSVQRGGYSGLKADMWCLGVVLYSMLVGRYPYHDVEPRRIINKIRMGEPVFVPQCFSPRVRSLLANLLHRQPTRRLSLADVVDHPFLNERDRTPSLAAQPTQPLFCFEPWTSKEMFERQQAHEREEESVVPSLDDAAAPASS